MQTSTADPAVRCHVLSRRYGDLVAVDGVASFLLELSSCPWQ
jgi:hypothetical protein